MSEEIVSHFNKTWGAIDNDKYDVAKEEKEYLETIDIPDKHVNALKMLRTMYYLLVNDPEQAMLEIESLVNSVDNLSFAMKAEVYVIYARVMAYLGDISQAEVSIESFKELIVQPAEEAVQKVWYLSAEVDIVEGLIAVSNKNFTTALKRFEAAIQNFKAQNRVNQMARALFYEGQILHLTGKKADAMVSIDKAIDAFKRIRNDQHLYLVYDALIKLYRTDEETEKVQEYTKLRDEVKNQFDTHISQNSLYHIVANYEEDKPTEELKSVEELEKTISQQSTEISELKGKLSALQSKLESVDSLQDSISELETSKQQLTTKSSELEEKISSLEESNKKLEEDHQKLDDEYQDSLAKIETLSTQLVESQQQITEFEDQIQKTTTSETDNLVLQSQVKQKDLTIDKLKIDITRSEQNIKELTTKLDIVNNELQEVNNQKNLSLIKLKEVENKLLEAEDELKVVQSKEISEVTSQISEEELNEIKITNRKIDDENKRLTLELKDAENKISELDAKLEVVNSTNDRDKSVQPSDDNQKLVHENQELKLEINSLNDKISELQKEVSRLKTQVEMDEHAEDKSTATPVVSTQEEVEDLDELIISDKLMDLIYHRMKSLQKIKLKVLAMQLGVNIEDCRRVVGVLQDHGVLNMEGKSDNITFVATD